METATKVQLISALLCCVLNALIAFFIFLHPQSNDWKYTCEDGFGGPMHCPWYYGSGVCCNRDGGVKENSVYSCRIPRSLSGLYLAAGITAATIACFELVMLILNASCCCKTRRSEMMESAALVVTPVLCLCIFFGPISSGMAAFVFPVAPPSSATALCPCIDTACSDLHTFSSWDVSVSYGLNGGVAAFIITVATAIKSFILFWYAGSVCCESGGPTRSSGSSRYAVVVGVAYESYT